MWSDFYRGIPGSAGMALAFQVMECRRHHLITWGGLVKTLPEEVPVEEICVEVQDCRCSSEFWN